MDNTTNTQSKSSPTPAVAVAKTSRKHCLFVSVSIIFSIIALVLGGLALVRIKQNVATSQVTQTLLLAQVNEINQDLNKQHQALERTNNFNQSLLTQQQQLAQQIKSSNQTIAAFSQHKHPVDDALWQLKKAYYLMQLAQFNLHWNHDVTSSELLLQHADQLISELDLADAIEIREALAREITQLTAIPVIDKLGMMSKLAAITQAIPQLPLNYENNLQLPSSTDKSPTVYQSGWRNAVYRVWQELQKIVIIRHHTQPISPLLPPEQRRLLDDRIILLLQQAQWALLQPNADIFQLSLQQALELIKQHFALDDVKTKAVLKQLAELKQQEIAPSSTS